jgi:hypothetical protein
VKVVVGQGSSPGVVVRVVAKLLPVVVVTISSIVAISPGTNEQTVVDPAMLILRVYKQRSTTFVLNASAPATVAITRMPNSIIFTLFIMKGAFLIKKLNFNDEINVCLLWIRVVFGYATGAGSTCKYKACFIAQ